MDQIESSRFRYQIDVWQEKDGWYLAEVWAGENHWVTQGRNEEEIWAMISDSVLTVNDVPLSWWNRFVSRLLIYSE